MSDPRKTPKSKYTADRQMPGAFEGETVSRRRFMTLTAHGAGAVAASAFLLPALGFAAGSAIFERPEVQWETVGVPGDFPKDTYIPKVITEVSGVGEIGKTTVYMRAHNEEIDGPVDPDIPGTGEFIAISTRCMHLGCPVRYVEASARFICPCHGGVYDFEGRSPAARRSARSTASSSACRTARCRWDRATRSTRASSASRPTGTRVRTSTASASTCTPHASRRPSFPR